MKKMLLLSLLCICGYAVEPTQNNPLTAIGILSSSLCPKGYVWARGKVTEDIDSDAYTIEDSTGKILLFLPTDELEALPIKVGTYVLVYGKVDISPVRPEKNELYAEKVILFEN
jgi:hypothetical protein